MCVLVKLVTPQLSVAVGATQVTTDSHTPAVFDTEISAGHELITGSSVSVTTTSKLHVTLFPAASVAVYVTVVVPTGNTSPLLCVLVKLVTPQLSDAVGATHVVAAPHTPASFVMLISDGQAIIDGNWSSVTVTNWLHVEVFP